MEKTIKSVKFVFENCERRMEFSADEIDYILIDSVEKLYIKEYYSNSLREYKKCKKFKILLNSKANKMFTNIPFNTFKKILEYNDISSIIIQYDDCIYPEDEFQLIWNFDYNTQENTYQKTEIRDNGLFISVKKRKYKGD